MVLTFSDDEENIYKGVLEVISNNKVSKDLEKALRALEQAKQRVANEKTEREPTAK